MDEIFFDIIFYGLIMVGFMVAYYRMASLEIGLVWLLATFLGISQSWIGTQLIAMTTFKRFIVFTLFIISIVGVLILVVGAIQFIINDYQRFGIKLRTIIVVFGLVVFGGMMVILADTVTKNHPQWQVNLTIIGLLGFISSMIIFWFTYLSLLIPAKAKNYQNVVILGCGLLKGNQISNYLAKRLDKGIKHFNYLRKNKIAKWLVMSGGQGPDETETEARAMANYAMNNGIEKQSIILEEESTSTYENLINTLSILSNLSYDDKKMTLVTSRFHLMRALSYARDLKLEIEGIAAPSPFELLPLMLFREYVAIIVLKWKWFLKVYGIFLSYLIINGGLR